MVEMKLSKCVILLILFITVSNSLKSQDRVDTIYYDREWKVIKSKQFAEFYRYALYPENKSARKLYRGYYISGELNCSGSFINLDESDDSKSIFDGECVTYYKNGNLSSKRSFSNGIENGESIDYSEDGYIKRRSFWLNGELDGLQTEFIQRDSYMQIDYKSGRPRYDYYIKGDSNGNMSKYSILDDQPILDSISIEDRNFLFQDETPWQYYFKNGIMLALTHSPIKDYGKWHRVDVIITNNSMEPVEFDSDNLSAYSIYEEFATNLPVWSCDRYIKKVNRTQKLTSFLVVLTETLAATAAGITTSQTYTSGHNYGVNGGFTSSVSTTYSFNAAEAYQAQVIANNNIAEFENKQLKVRELKEEGYIKKCIVNPGETISGFIHIDRISWGKLYITAKLGDATYMFDWNNKR
ncbi:MAG: toxin-antitoxin system YwqK family antitoxin [Bacteroidales bacterium]